MEALWVVAAFALGWAGSKAGLPPLVGYLLAGLGLSLFGQKSGVLVDELASIGVLLLLFTVGLKLRWQSLVTKEVLLGGGVHLAIFSTILAVLALIAGLATRQAWVVGISLAFSSTVLAVKLLEGRSELSTFHGRISVGVLVLQDLAAMGVLMSLGAKALTPWAALLILLVGLRPALHWLIERLGHSELFLLFGIGMALAFGALFSAAGVSPELGALLAGALLAGHDASDELSKTMWGVKEFFLVAFFLKMGLYGIPDPQGLLRVAGLLALLPLKGVLFFGLFVLFGLRARTAFVAAVSLSTYSEFALITASAAVAAGLLGPEWASVMGLAVLASLVAMGPVNKAVHTLFDKWEPFLERFQRQGEHPDEEPTTVGLANWVVVGMGRTGGAAYKALDAMGHRVAGLDADLARVQRHLNRKRRVIYGDAEDPDLWHGLQCDNIEGIILTLPDIEAKLRAIKGLRTRGYKGVIAATTLRSEEDALLRNSGVDHIFHPYATAGRRLAEEAVTLASNSADARQKYGAQ